MKHLWQLATALAAGGWLLYHDWCLGRQHLGIGWCGSHELLAALHVLQRMSCFVMQHLGSARLTLRDC